MPEEHGEEARRDAHHHHAGEQRVEPHREAFAEDAQSTAERYRGNAQQDFAEVHVKANHAVVEAELERIAQDVSRLDHERSGVGP